MGDHATLSNDPAANAPDAAFADKGKGKAQDPTQELSMDEDESESESENEMADNDLSILSLPLFSFLTDVLTDFLPASDDEEDENLEPISASNIIQGGRRTRGKAIDYAEVAEKSKSEGDEMEEDDDDDDFEAPDDNDNNDDDQMRD
ncbi:hypothetical protein NUU61_002521 [Penicillium alfredii]|uniref:Histone chaperone domain-containing protein n=1 Tax=Penicillium alfredii TaxID=1506179 RepID=A0A9W9FRP8_9EURO|nr:uncharacterized protein NUU61_002521 [Penicillium alfredii]KAJ5105174.1 hypothetical protein NUU61_002521 [Penicillium alfredii]